MKLGRRSDDVLERRSVSTAVQDRNRVEKKQKENLSHVRQLLSCVSPSSLGSEY